MVGIIDNWGRKLVGGIVYTKDVLGMIYLSIRAVMLDQTQGLRTIFGVVSAQIYFTGWQALPLISVLAVASGSIVILQSSAQLNLLGGVDMIGKLLVVIIVRELAPLITALVVVARSGTAVASEIGTMKVNREIEALESMGIHPLSYVVFPRLIGGIVSVLALCFYFSLIAILGGFFLTRFLNDMSLAFFIDSIAQAMGVEDMLLFLAKNSFSGAIIFTVCCYQGLSVKLSPHEVPQATTKAVVHSMIYVMVFNFFVTALFYLQQLMQLGVI